MHSVRSFRSIFRNDRLGKEPAEVLNTNTFRHCNPEFLHIWDVIDGVHLLDVFGF